MSLRYRSLNRALLTGSAWAFSGKVLAILAALVTNGILARVVSPEAFGAYLLAVSIVTTLSVVTTLGTNSALVPLVARSDHEPRSDYARGVLFKCLLIGFSAALLLGLLITSPLGTWISLEVFQSHLLAASVVGMACWLLALTWQSICAEAHRSLKDVRLASMTSGPFFAVSLMAAVAVAASADFTLSPKRLMWLCAGCSAFAFTLGVVLLPKGEKDYPKSETPDATTILALSTPMMVTNFAAILLNQVDVWIVGIFASGDELALYGSALAIASLISFPLLILNSAAAPYLADRRDQQNHETVEDTVRAATTYASALSLLGVSMVIIGAPTIMALIYGEFYREASMILTVLAVGRFVNVATGPCGLLLMVSGYHSLLMWINLVISAAAVALMVIVAKPFGVIGIAGTAAAMMILQNFTLLILARTKTGMWTHLRLPLAPRQRHGS